MDSDANRWCVSASYLYTLHLDHASLAWEYLRRNPAYRSAYGDCLPLRPESPERWRLLWLEDPRLDARLAHPRWDPTPRACATLTADPDQSVDADRFELWRLPGSKVITHDGRLLLLTVNLADRIVRLRLDRSVQEGAPIAYVVPSGARAQRYWRLSQQHAPPSHCGVIERDRVGSNGGGLRLRIMHMRALQALDGALAGATLREVAVAIFGAERVEHSWNPDSELRAQVRHLIARGHALMRGGYRRLLDTDAAGREI